MAVPDNGPLIISVTWALCIVSGAFLTLRLYAKISRRQGLWWDDHILITSWAFLLVESALTQRGVILGFGKHGVDIPRANLPEVALGTIICASISCFASTFSKISFGVTLLRLTSSYTRVFVWFCIVTLFSVMLPSAVLTWFSCRPVQKSWNTSVEGECWDPKIIVDYGIFNAVWCTWIDFMLALLPWKLIWGLQMQWKEKVGVGIAMSMGLLSGICAIVKGVYLTQLADQDFFYNGKDVTIWTAVETATAIVGASIPVLRVFFKNTIDSYRSTHTCTTKSRSSAFPLSNVQGSHSSSRSRPSRYFDDEQGILNDDDYEDLDFMVDPSGRVHANVMGSGRGNGESAGMVTQDPRDQKNGGILQTSTVTVQYEGRDEERSTTAKGIATAL